MKVLHIYQVYRPDDFTGIPRIIWELCEGMAVLGVESEVLCLSDSASENPKSVGSHLVHTASRNLTIASARLSVDVFLKFKKLVNNFDIIHYHYPWPIGDALHILFGSQKPSLVTYHSDIVKRNYSNIFMRRWRRYFEKANSIVATSHNYATSSMNLLKHQDKVAVIPLDYLRDLRLRWKDKILGQFGRKGFFLFVGALRYYKGLNILIEAARDWLTCCYCGAWQN